MKITQTHPLRDLITPQISTYILTHWSFPSTSTQQLFQTADLTGLTTHLFPFALDERIHMSALLFSLIYLIDAVLIDMEIEDGEDFLDHLQDTVKGYWDCDRERAEEWMLCDLVGEMQSFEYLLTGEVVNAVFGRLRLRNVQRRFRLQGKQDWMTLRNNLFGDELIELLLKFVMGLGFDADLSIMGFASGSNNKSLGEESRGRRLRRRGETISWPSAAGGGGGVVGMAGEQQQQACVA